LGARVQRRVGDLTYTWTFFSDTDAKASLGNRSTESAASPATTRATVVKKPKTACARLREECIVDDNAEWSSVKG